MMPMRCKSEKFTHIFRYQEWGCYTVGVDVAPWIFIALESRGRLGLLGERLGDEDALVGTGVPLLALGGGDLVSSGSSSPGTLTPLLHRRSDPRAPIAHG